MKKKKLKFIYLIQGDLSFEVPEIPSGSSFLYLQWQPAFKPRENHFHFPNSTWTEGRNELFNRAPKTFDYYVFLDDDLQFMRPERLNSPLRVFSDTHLQTQKPVTAITNTISTLLSKRSWCLKDFEDKVQKSRPAIAVPNADFFSLAWYQTQGVKRVVSTKYWDHNFMAIHREAALQLMPYDTSEDSKNWWLSGEKFCVAAHNKFPEHIHRYNALFVSNQASREYPRNVDDWTLASNTVSRAKRFSY